MTAPRSALWAKASVEGSIPPRKSATISTASFRIVIPFFVGVTGGLETPIKVEHRANHVEGIFLSSEN
jgi:hypothetical protein